MTGRQAVIALALALSVAGCAAPHAVLLTPEEQYEPELVTIPPATPPPDTAPIEPVEPPLPAPDPPPSASSPPVPVVAQPSREPPASIAMIAPAPAADEPTEDQQMLALLADLQRFGTLSSDDLRRERDNATAALTRQRTDANRVRLAVLYTLVHATPQDDQRALQLFDNVARSNPGSMGIKQLAAVLQLQITERQRAVRDEQQKADKAIQKLEALREMERSLLRDRVRSGGGGGGGGGGGSAGH